MIYPHAVTVWRRVEEGRSVKWERKLLARCRFEPTFGAKPDGHADESERSADLIVKTRGKPFGKGDKAVLGSSDSSEPPKGAFVVESVSMVSIGDAPLHWEAQLR